MLPPTSFTAIVHPFSSPTPNACAYELGLSEAANALVFIGGLGDGPHTVPYPRAIAKTLEQHADLSYSVFEFRLKSSFSGFGFARLADDVADISALVKYLRSIGKQKVVLLGHSTGCQDIMEYTSPVHIDVAAVDGLILQAPVADRGALEIDMGREFLSRSVTTATDLIKAGKGHDRMPPEQVPKGFGPVSAHRWFALAAEGGEDDYFSHDLPKKVVSAYWQRIEKPLLILHSGQDEYIPPSIDKDALIEEWKGFCRLEIASELSGCIPGANHRVEQPDSEKWLAGRVVEFLATIQ